MDQQPESGTLPSELTIEILQHLYYRELLICRLVSRWFQLTIDNHSPFQYKISLAITGASDNPSHRATATQKLALLAQHRAKWSSSSFISDIQAADEINVYTVLQEPWELVAGVLAQTMDADRIEFIKLPARIRGIQAKTWNVKLPCSHEDFTIDPGQDLLLLVEQNAPGQTKGTVHLLNMLNAEAHQLARHPTLEFDHQPFVPMYYHLRIHGPYVGLLVSDADSSSELTVWNWHTGETSFIMSNSRLTSFVFLNDTYLLAILRKEWDDDPEPSLNLVNYRQADSAMRLRLLLPPISDSDEIQEIELLCEPGSPSSPSSGDRPPFHLLDATAGDRLVVLHMREVDRLISFSILVSKLLELPAIFPRHDEVEWHDWGGQRCFVDEVPRSTNLRGCAVFGTKYVFVRPAAKEPGLEVVIREFGERWRRWEATRRILASSSRSAPTADRKTLPAFLDQEPSDFIVFKDSGNSSTEMFSSWDTLGPLPNFVLERAASTSIPFMELVMPCSLFDDDQVMLSEDSIVVAKHGGGDATEYNVYTC